MGSLPASTEIVLEIQLNRVIRDFLFPAVAVGDGNVSPLSTEAQEAEPRNGDPRPWKASNLSAESAVATTTAACRDLHVHDDDCSSGLRFSYDFDGRCNAAPDKSSPYPPAGEIGLNLHDQTSNLCISQSTETVKLLWLCKSGSLAGSPFSFPMRMQGEIAEKEEKCRTSERGRKLTRMGTVPCHSRVSDGDDKRFRCICQKPPRPPPLEMSSDRGHAARDSLLVLHGTSKRSRMERRKRHAGRSSSNAALWAFVLTLLFALAMLREGFRSTKSSLTRSNSRRSLSIHNAIANRDMKLNAQTVIMERTLDSGPDISSQLEKEMQMHEFWTSRDLDPS